MTLSRLQTDTHMSGERTVCPAYCPPVRLSCCLAVSVSRSDSAAAANCGCLLQHSWQITEISHNSPAVAVASSRCHACPMMPVCLCACVCVKVPCALEKLTFMLYLRARLLQAQRNTK